MTLEIEHSDIKRLDHKKFINFLESNGWEKTDDLRDVAEIWTDGNIKLAIPNKKNLSDYNQRLYEALLFLADRYELNPKRLLDVMEKRRAPSKFLTKYSSFDQISFRISEIDTADGSIPLDKAVKVIDAIRQSMYSAARSVVDPRAYYVNRAYKPVEDYIKSVRLGQTSIGSYVFNIVSPVGQSDKNRMLEVATFERQVANGFYSALRIVEDIHSEKEDIGSIRSIFDMVNKGLSANICKSLSDLIPEDSGVLEISFDWGESAPQNRSRKFKVDSDIAGSLLETYEVLKKTANLDEQRILGAVESLSKRRTDEIGRVGIAALVNGRPTHVTLRLSGSDYANAVRAHEENLNIRLSGRLVKRGNAFLAEDVSKFEIDDQITLFRKDR